MKNENNKKIKKLSTVAITFLAVLLFINTQIKNVSASGESITYNVSDYASPSNAGTPRSIHIKVPFFTGNNPPRTQFYQTTIWGRRYRGYLTRTNITDTRHYVLYEGYIYRDDQPLPMPAKIDLEK